MTFFWILDEEITECVWTSYLDSTAASILASLDSFMFNADARRGRLLDVVVVAVVVAVVAVVGVGGSLRLRFVGAVVVVLPPLAAWVVAIVFKPRLSLLLLPQAAVLKLLSVRPCFDCFELSITRSSGLARFGTHGLRSWGSGIAHSFRKLQVT